MIESEVDVADPGVVGIPDPAQALWESAMNKFRDYAGFTVWFAGLGYLALWPLAAEGQSGRLFGAALICGTRFGLLDILCRWPHPLALSSALHMLGALAALIVVAQLGLRALRRVQRPTANHTIAVPPHLMPARDAAPPARHQPIANLPPVKPRAHFGLRGAPR